jgi:hypothetical protein
MNTNEITTATTDDDTEGWNDFLPAAYVEIKGGDPENNAYYMS